MNVVFQQVYEDAIVRLVKVTCVVKSMSLSPSKSSRRNLLENDKVYTTATFTLQSFLGISDLRGVLSGVMVTDELVNAGYSVTAKDPVLTDMSPTPISTNSTPESISSNGVIAAITLGSLAFIALVLGFVYYFIVAEKVEKVHNEIIPFSDVLLIIKYEYVYIHISETFGTFDLVVLLGDLK